MEQIAVWLIRC